MKVRELEGRLLELLPADIAEPWDRTGMLVGSPGDEVAAVAVALDPTLAAFDFAREWGANVLLTHHPLFLEAPQAIMPPGTADAVGGRIWRAVEYGISVISFHTALDASPRAAQVLARPLGLQAGPALLQEIPGHPGCGYGRICAADGRPAAAFRDACARAFGGAPRLWGDGTRPVGTACLWTGAAGTCPRACREMGIDLLVCGEVKYHEAIDAIEGGLAIVELGHDVSEQPHCDVLVECAREAGMGAGRVHAMGLPTNWR